MPFCQIRDLVLVGLTGEDCLHGAFIHEVHVAEVNFGHATTYEHVFICQQRTWVLDIEFRLA